MKRQAASFLICVLMTACCFFMNTEFSLNTGAASDALGFGGVTSDPEGTRIDWYYSEDNGKYYLFVPSTADLSALTLYHDFSEEITIDGTEVASGDTVDFLEDGGEYEVSAGSVTYTLCVMKADNIPAMFIITSSGSLDKIHADKDYKESGTMLLVQSDGTVEYNGTLDFIKGRGNTTWNLAKKPYNIKLSTAADLLSMGKSKRWCLLANAQEPTQLRNKIMYDLADSVGLDYSVSSEFVDLYINGEYLGVYQLCQKIEVGNNDLVDITDLEELTEEANDTDDLSTFSAYSSGNTRAYKITENPDDITGGYLLEYNSVFGGESYFETSRGQKVDLKSPEYASVEQVEYISTYVQEAEDAVYSADGYNSEGKYYTEYYDLDSCVKMYLLQELSKNVDSGITSCFFYKETESNGGKLTAGPAWDFDVALGNLSGKSVDGTYYDLTDPEGLWAAIAGNDTMNSGELTIFAALCQHEDFMERASEIWKEYFLPAIEVILGSSDSEMTVKSIDEYEEYFADSVEMNYIRWKLTDNLLVNSGTTHEANLTYLKNFISDRADFMSISFLSLEDAKEEIVESLEEFFETVDNYDTGEDYEKIEEIMTQALEDIEAAASADDATQIKNDAIDEMKNYMKITVYFDNSVVNWETPYIHIWNCDDETSWPGVEMEQYDGDIYMAEVSLNASIIFDNGSSSEQTVDITDLPDNPSVYIIDIDSNSGDDDNKRYSGSWQTYEVEESDTSALQTLVEEARLYFTDEISDLGDVLSAAEALLQKQNPSQDTVDEQTAALQEVLDKIKSGVTEESNESTESTNVFPAVVITAVLVSLVWALVLLGLKKKKQEVQKDTPP